MTEQMQKRGPGRPRTGYKTQRIYPSLPLETVAFLGWLIGEKGNLSAYLDRLIKADPRYAEWKQQQNKEQQQ